MSQFIPIRLTGNNLGERHRYLNSLVRDAFDAAVSFESIQDLPEGSPVDRLFKIDLASKYRNVDYIIRNLKDTDMLYVSEAMKCTWLLERQYENIINAFFLEAELFPEMTSIAVYKMQHWIQHHLRDPERCKHFYNYYKDRQFKIAIKFLWHCSNEFIVEEFNSIIDKIDPNNLKVLSEKYPRLTRMFYENIESNQNVLKHYLSNEKNFFSNIKYILKSDPDTFFYVIEKYHSDNKFRCFGPDITKHIMINHRDIFFSKPELYTARLLHIDVLPKYLSSEEIKEVVLKLAKAEYLKHWFTYKKVEPLIKRLNNDERVVFKKLIFVDKSFGEIIKDWPYTPPTSPVLKDIPGYSIFHDKENDSFFVRKMTTKRLIKKRCIKGSALLNQKIKRCRTLLDDLFDRYRFMSFQATLFELRKRLRGKSKLQNREFMMLVLISKSGGREDSLRTLFELLSQYRNEPVHFRAAIVRSLVKRAFVWRLPDDMWTNLLQLAHGMGLDGGSKEISCIEGLHAVVLRNLLSNQAFDATVSKLFFDNFTYFTQYSLTNEERRFLRCRLPNMILEAAKLETGYDKYLRLGQLLSALEEYKVRFDSFPDVIEAIKTAAQEDLDSAQGLLIRLYSARVARKLLFKENFSLIQDNASYINALNHDISIISVDKFKNVVEYASRSTFEPFVKKLVLYFSETGGLADQFYVLYRQLAETQPHQCLAKSLSILARQNFGSLLKTFQSSPKKSAERSLAAELETNAYRTRPRIEINVNDKKGRGAKVIANLINTCPQNQVEDIVKQILTSGRTIRLAITLTKCEEVRCCAYKNLSKLRPGVALKTFLNYIKTGKFGSGFNTIWNTVKSLIIELDYVNRPRLLKNLGDVKFIPASIKTEYCVLVYQAYINIDKDMALKMLCHIENICYEVQDDFFFNVIKDLLNNDLIEERMMIEDYLKIKKCSLYSRLISKFLLLSKTEDTQRKKLDFLEAPFFQRIEKWWKSDMDKDIVNAILEEFLRALKYNKVFFNANYVSCMPVFERILRWMHNMLPIEKWFDVYIHIHLTMLYYKSVKLCISQQPGLFTGDYKNLDKSIDILGSVYGQFLLRDYEDLVVKYFPSIREIYQEELMNYFRNSIDYATYDQSKERFVIAIVKSILDKEGAKEAHILASHVFVEHEKYHFKYKLDLSCIKEMLKKTSCEELNFYVNIQNDDYNELL